MTDPPLAGITVVSFESRMADETVRLLEKQGARCISAPSMQEVPLERHAGVLQFGERLFRGEVDVVVLLTGVGTAMLVNVLETHHDRREIIDRLRQTVLLARGPKPVRALRDLGMHADVKVPEPNTWRELLETVDKTALLQPVAGRRYAIQEYGAPNEELVAGLRERGADVEQVAIYRWELPDDVEPLRSGIAALVDGKATVAVFTSRTQVDHVMELARRDDREADVRAALRRAFVASIGPVCSEGLRGHGIEPDLEPEHPKLGVLIRDLAARFGDAVTAQT